MIEKLFNIPLTPPIRAQAAKQMAEPPAPTAGVLNSSQGAATFLGAPAAVTLIWKVLKAIWVTPDPHAFINSPPCGALIATVIGVCVWFASSAPAPENDTARAKMGRSLSAIFSIFAIIAATLGINPAPPPEKGSDPKSPPAKVAAPETPVPAK